MKQNQLRRTARSVLAGCALQLALPAWAAEGPKAPLPQPEARPLAAAAERKASEAAVARTSRVSQDAAPVAAASDSQQPFLKSPKGIAVILLMAAGTGYAIYAATNQRISNPLR